MQSPLLEVDPEYGIPKLRATSPTTIMDMGIVPGKGIKGNSLPYLGMIRIRRKTNSNSAIMRYLIGWGGRNRIILTVLCDIMTNSFALYISILNLVIKFKIFKIDYFILKFFHKYITLERDYITIYSIDLVNQHLFQCWTVQKDS